MRVGAALGFALGVALAVAPAAQAADPGSGTLGKDKSVTWSGGPFVASNPAGCAGPSDPSCDHYILTIDPRAAKKSVSIAVTAAEGEDFDLFVYGPDGAQVASSATAAASESVVLASPAAGDYEVRVQPWLVTPGATYEGAARVSRESATIDDGAEECLEPLPASASVPGVTDTGQTVGLAVRVLLDGVGQAAGEAAMAKAAEAYAPLGVGITASYQSVSFTGTEGDALIQQAKQLMGGSRPAGVDIVYVLTAKDLTTDGDTGLAGLADCIGGVRYPTRAFAVGELFADENTPWNGFMLYTNATAEIAAHEIGHLMGAHHHYANCLEGSRSPDPVGDGCSLMFNFIDLTSLMYSTANLAVVRGHAVMYASP